MDETLREPTINYKSLTDAIVRIVGMSSEERPAAEGIADHLLGFFGFQDRVIDNLLAPADRNVFYQLQDWGLLTTASEETTLWDGRQWRIHYWLLRTDKILNWNPPEEPEVDPEIVNIYDNLSSEDWGIETYNEDDAWLPKKRKLDEYYIFDKLNKQL
jgi:hypothetical protein